MLPSTDVYKSVLHGPHHRVAYIDATDIDGNVLAARVPIVSGTVRAQLTDRVTRTADFTLSDEWFPRTAVSAFSPYLSVVHITAGTGYSDGTEEVFPLFTGRVYDVARQANGSVNFRADDLAADVVAARFEVPEKSSSASVCACATVSGVCTLVIWTTRPNGPPYLVGDVSVTSRAIRRTGSVPSMRSATTTTEFAVPSLVMDVVAEDMSPCGPSRNCWTTGPRV